jgi:hypothetical protein
MTGIEYQRGMKLILNTTYDGNRTEGYYPVSFPQRDPRYLYPEKYTAEDPYRSLLSPSPAKSVIAGEGLLNHSGIDDLLLQRDEIIDSRLDMLMSDIYQRRKLEEDNLYRINLDQCTCRNLIYRMDRYVWDKKRVDVEKKIIDLEQEKRREQADYFRDILFLKKELRETLVEKLEEQQKLALLAEQEEEPK